MPWKPQIGWPGLDHVSFSEPVTMFRGMQDSHWSNEPSAFPGAPWAGGGDGDRDRRGRRGRFGIPGGDGMWREALLPDLCETSLEFHLSSGRRGHTITLMCELYMHFAPCGRSMMVCNF